MLRKFCLAVMLISAFAFGSEAGPTSLTINPQGTSAGATGPLRMKELVANGQNVTGFKAPDSLAADVIYTLPSAAGTGTYVLQTDGSKVLSWVQRELPLTFSTGLTRSTNTITVNTSQNITTLSNLTSNGFVKTSGGAGTLSVTASPLTVPDGGLGAATFAAGGVLYGNGASAVQVTSAPTSGQILVGNTTTPAFVTMGTDATITNTGALTIANNAITTAKISDANVTTAKLTSAARPWHNYLINGGFEFFQRGQLNAVTTAAVLDGTYAAADRWFWITNAGGVGSPTYTFKQVDASAEGTGYAAEIVTSGGTNTRYICLSQIVEARATYALRGRTVRFQARVKQASSTATWKAVLINWTGTADTSIAKNLVNNWSSTTYTEGNFFTTNGSYDIAAVGSDTVVGTSYTDVAVTGTVSSSANNFYVALFCITGNATTADITKCGLYDGADARDWLPRAPGLEVELCQRYYEKSYDLGTAPGTTTTTEIVFIPHENSTVGNSTRFAFVRYRVLKVLSSPSVVVYPYTTPANTGRVSDGNGNDLAASSGGTNSAGPGSFSVQNNSGGTITPSASGGFLFHWSADSEL